MTHGYEMDCVYSIISEYTNTHCRNQPNDQLTTVHGIMSTLVKLPSCNGVADEPAGKAAMPGRAFRLAQSAMADECSKFWITAHPALSYSSLHIRAYSLLNITILTIVPLYLHDTINLMMVTSSTIFLTVLIYSWKYSTIYQQYTKVHWTEWLSVVMCFARTESVQSSRITKVQKPK